MHEKCRNAFWRRGVVVITTARLHSTKPELRFCAGWNPAPGVSEIPDGEDLWQWSWLEIRLNAFRRSTIPHKQFIINSFILSNFNYCPLVWRFSSCESIKKIGEIQKRLLRIILNDCENYYETLFCNSNTPTMEIRRLRTLAD